MVVTIFILLCLGLSQSEHIAEGKDLHSFGNLHIVRAKRSLDWRGNPYRILYLGNDNQKIEVKYLKPHSRNARDHVDNRAYIGFTLYMDDRSTIPGNTGIFHFALVDDVNHLSCPRPTTHAKAYNYFYNRCPEDTSGIVASGYCMRNGKMVYNSMTFNDKYFYYQNKNYYNNDNNRDMNSIEKKILDYCYNGWKNGGYSESYSCDVTRVPESVFMSLQTTRNESLVSSDKSSLCGCDYCTASDSPHHFHWKVFLNVCLFAVLAKYAIIL